MNETGLFHEPLLQCEATYNTPFIDNACSQNNVPLHILFKKALPIFKRSAGKPDTLSKKFLRFFQNFVASNPGEVVSFLQVESLLCPSVFYYQLREGSFVGALPYFLYNKTRLNSQLMFASLYEHIFARITNMELPVAGNVKYLYMLTDALLNVNLHQTVTSNFFKRGVQNIEIAGQKMNSFTESMNYTLTDSEKNVKELAAAMRDKKPTLFLTLTLNQKEHFGVSPLIKAVEASFPDKTSEKYRACMQTYMPVLLRMWSLTVDQLIRYLLQSSEKILGEIVNIWGRTEFQSLIGNVPHYHLLLWLKDITLEDLQDLVASTKKHLRFKFHELFRSDLQIVKNAQDMEQIFESFVKIHTHTSEKGNNRCMKKLDAHGNKVCRFPPYQPSNVTWLKEIPQSFSDEAMKVLLEVGLAEGDIEDFQFKQEMKCHKFSYPATNKDHIMPNSPKPFALTLSSGNVLLITEKMASKYLNKYAAGKEEHAEVHVTAGPSEKRIKVNVGQIENNKITE